MNRTCRSARLPSNTRENRISEASAAHEQDSDEDQTQSRTPGMCTCKTSITDHFATWPEALCERIIKAGCPERVLGCPVCRVEYVYDAAGLRELRGNVFDEVPTAESHAEVLLDPMRGAVQCAEASRPHANDEGIHSSPLAGAPSGVEARLRDGASLGDGEEARSATDGGRGCPSPERREGRQSRGESRGSAEAAARSQAEEGTASAAVSSLRRGDLDSGWNEPHCPTCDARLASRAGVVLDPFMGSGTTALVARRLGRKAIGVELNEQYAELATRRLGQQSLLAGADG